MLSFAINVKLNNTCLLKWNLLKFSTAKTRITKIIPFNIIEANFYIGTTQKDTCGIN